MSDEDTAIRAVTATAERIPTPQPESDGTPTWDSTTIVVAHVHADGKQGLGWTYADAACVGIITSPLAEVLIGRDALDVPARWHGMQRHIRNLGRPGLVSCAISAVDIALWDLAARLHGVPVSRLLGRVHDTVPVYARGPSAPGRQPARQLGRDLVRGTRVQRRPGRPARSPAQRQRRRHRGRVRLRPRVLHEDDRSGSGGLRPGRPHPMRRLHRMAPHRGPRRRTQPRRLRALRPEPLRPRRPSDTEHPSHRMVRRPRPDRTPPVRRRARSHRRPGSPALVGRRPRHDIEGTPPH